MLQLLLVLPEGDQVYQSNIAKEYILENHLNSQVVVHGFMESDSYSPLLNISVIPQVTYRLVSIR